MYDLDIQAFLKKLPELDSNCGLALIGFDGFTDNIISTVNKRESIDHYEPMKKIKELGQKIIDSSEVSCNIELVVKRQKIGGNGPILANALLQSGHKVSFIGAIGENGHIEPLFQEMASLCKDVYSIAKSAHTDALEFEDGKVLLGKHESIMNIDFEKILLTVGRDNLIRLLDQANVFVSANWTMLPLMNEIWKNLQKNILPFLNQRKVDAFRYLFIDLADPQKREDKDLLEALQLLKNWGTTHKVILGLNASESLRVARLLKCNTLAANDNDLKQMATSIKNAMKIDTCVIHTKQIVAACNEKETIAIKSPYCPHPTITTGAGDNFNAGFCSGLLFNLNLQECLILAIATAGFYIRNAHSPNLNEIKQFLTSWIKQEI
jgi:sugar/nucleoside kinase (ribokinase family)